MSNNLDEPIRIFCDKHQSVFETPRKPALVCDITDHPLSVNFPHAEHFEFCCDCETFFPSTLQLGEKVRKTCPLCERRTALRFICSTCNVVSYDSKEETRGAAFVIRGASPVLPRCPGCDQTDIKEMVAHQCPTAGASFITSLVKCPFCLSSTSIVDEVEGEVFEVAEVDIPRGRVESLTPGHLQATSESPSTIPLGPIKCEACFYVNTPDSLFCTMCGVFLPASGARRPPSSQFKQVGVRAPLESASIDDKPWVPGDSWRAFLKVLLALLAVGFFFQILSRC